MKIIRSFIFAGLIWAGLGHAAFAQTMVSVACAALSAPYPSNVIGKPLSVDVNGSICVNGSVAVGQYNTGLPTLTNGQISYPQLDVNGRLILAPNSPSTALFFIPNSNTDTGALITHTAASAGVNGSDQINTSAHGINVVVNITAITGTTPSLTVTLQGKDTASGVYYNILASAALTATGTTVLTVFPGATAAANLAANAILPRTWRVITAIAGTTPAVTATVGASVIE